MIWSKASDEVNYFVKKIMNQIQDIIGDNIVGYYLHGSLAIGGFNPKSSDIDLLVVTKNAVPYNEKVMLTKLFLQASKNPFPIEISFMNKSQLEKWVYPPAYDYHYSEYWRVRFEDSKEKWLLEENTDADLAAHITIINYKGICLKGQSIKDVFPPIPTADYIASILGDYNDCIRNIEQTPVYSILNTLRVFRFLKEGAISSKMEAGEWGRNNLPEEHRLLVSKASDIYIGKTSDSNFPGQMLERFKGYISKEIDELLTHLPS